MTYLVDVTVESFNENGHMKSIVNIPFEKNTTIAMRIGYFLFFVNLY